MNGITELAKLLKERENSDGYSPVFGMVIELPNTKIRISDKVILTDSHITLCINLIDRQSDLSLKALMGFKHNYVITFLDVNVTYV